MKYKDLNYINFSKEELEKLFTRAKNGDSQSFSELSGYVRHISYTYFLSKQRLKKIENIEDVEDLANNVYLSFAEQYQNIDNLEYWLRRVMFLNFINWYKKFHIKKTFELDKAYYIESKNPNPGDKIDADKILDVLNTFSEEKQLIIKLRFWEESKFAEIAEILNKSEDAVKKMFYRTVAELKDKL